MYTLAYSVPLLLDFMEEKQKVQVKVSEGVVCGHFVHSLTL